MKIIIQKIKRFVIVSVLLNLFFAASAFNKDTNFSEASKPPGLMSIGAGYKFYGINETKDSFAFVFEAYSIFYQSKDFNGGRLQTLAALQLWID